MFGKLLLREVEMEDLYSPNTSHSSGLDFCIFPFIVFLHVGVFPFIVAVVGMYAIFYFSLFYTSFYRKIFVLLNSF